jgi:hypothetical protein
MRLFSFRLLPSPPLLLLLVGSLCITTTGAVAAHGSRSDNMNADSTTAGGVVLGSALGFYEKRPDYYRKCPSPRCGGSFVRPIDGSLILCPGATEPAVECYVGRLRYSSTNDEEEPSWSEGGVWIVYGSMIPGNYDGAPDIYDFDVHDNGKAVAALQQIVLEYYVQHDDGGYWLDAVATNMTLCSDGSVETSCYVANLNFSGLDLQPQEEQVVWDQLRNRGTVKGYYIDNPEYDGLTSWPGKGMIEEGEDLKDLFVLETSAPTL